MGCLELRISVRRCIAILRIILVPLDHDGESQETRHILKTVETRNFTDVYLAASEMNLYIYSVCQSGIPIQSVSTNVFLSRMTASDSPLLWPATGLKLCVLCRNHIRQVRILSFLLQYMAGREARR